MGLTTSNGPVWSRFGSKLVARCGTWIFRCAEAAGKRKRLLRSAATVMSKPKRATRAFAQAAAPFASDVQRLHTTRRAFNLDVATGTRVMATVDQDPFIDADEVVVVLGRFEGTRSADTWPLVTVFEHFRPNAGIAY